MAGANQIDIQINSVLNSQANTYNLNQIKDSVRKAQQAIKTGNSQALAEAEAQYAKITGKKPAQAKIMVEAVVDPKTGNLTNQLKVDAGVMDPILKAQKKSLALHSQEEQAYASQLQGLKNLRDARVAMNKKHGVGVNRWAQEKMAIYDMDTQIKKMEESLVKLKTPASLKGQLAEVNQQLSMTPRHILDMNTGLTKSNPKFLELSAKSKQLSKELDMVAVSGKGFGTAMKGVGNAVNTAMGLIGAVVATLAALGAVMNSVVGRQKQIQQLTLTLEGVGVSIGQQEAVMASAKEIALSYGVSLGKVEGAYKRLAPAILESGGTLKDTEGAISSIAARTTMLGLNTEQAGRYIEAFAQVMGKGKLQSEELNQQFSELDGGLRGQLKNWLAVNRGIEDFDEAMKNGEITADVFLEAFDGINTEIREKFLRSIDDTNKALNKLGQEGGMTIAQFQAKMDTLTKIGLEEVGRTLAPIGTALAKMYAQFVMVFTKIATEMPGLQALWKGLSHVIGSTLVNSFGALMLILGGVMELINKITLAVMRLYEEMKKVPVLGGALEALEGIIANSTGPMDAAIDNFSKLSDETKGLDKELLSLQEELAELNKEWEGKEKTKEYQEALDALNTKIAREELNKLDAKLKEDLGKAEIRKKELEEEKKKEEEKLQIIADALKERLELEKEALEEEKQGIKELKQEAKKRYSEEKEAMKKAHASKMDALKEEEDAIKTNYETTKNALDNADKAAKKRFENEKDKLDEAKEAAERRYEADIAGINRAKAAAQGMYDQQIADLDKVIGKLEERHEAEAAAEKAAISSAKSSLSAVSDHYDAQIDAVNDKYDAIEAGLDREREAAEAAYELESNRLDQLESATKATFDRQIDGIKDAADASKRAHDSRKTQLQDELRYVKDVFDATRDRINAERNASQSASDGRIKSLEEMTPAERQLAALEIYDLKKKASDKTISSRERLEAQARLERMAREEQIEAEREAEAARQAAFEKQEREAEQAYLAEKERIETQMRANEEAERQRQEAFRIREAEYLAAKEQALAKIAADQEVADQRRDAAVTAIDAKEKIAAGNREAEITTLESAKNKTISALEGRIAAMEKQHEEAQERRKDEVDDLEDKKDEAKDRLEERIKEFDRQEEEFKNARKDKLEEIEDEKDRLVGVEQERLEEYDRMYEDLKRWRMRKEQDVDDKRERIKEDEKSRQQDLKGKYQELYDYYDDRLDDVETAMEDIEDEAKDIDEQVKNATTSQQNLDIAASATNATLQTQLGKVEAIGREYDDILTTVKDIQVRQASIRRAPGGGGSTGTTTTTSGGTGAGNTGLFGDNGLPSVSDSLQGLGAISTANTGLANTVGTLEDVANTLSNVSEKGIVDGLAQSAAESVVNAVQDNLNVVVEIAPMFGGGSWAQAQADRMQNDLFARKSGGAVAGGTRYKVNEQGQEGFLSSSGQLSAIKTPRLGKWTAPTSGTVINAKAWAKIKKASGGSIPKDLMQRAMGRNGVSVGQSAMPSQDGLINTVMNALGSMASGDNFNNNITITSDNPTKSAGDMMVSLARMRHRR